MIHQVLIGAITSKGRLQVVYARGVASELGDGWLPSQGNENEQFNQMQKYSPLKGVCKCAEDLGLPSRPFKGVQSHLELKGLISELMVL